MPNTTTFLKQYLEAVGFLGNQYDLKETQDETFGFLISLKISRTHPKVGVLIGKDGRHLRSLKELLRVVGATEGLRPFLIIHVSE